MNKIKTGAALLALLALVSTVVFFFLALLAPTSSGIAQGALSLGESVAQAIGSIVVALLLSPLTHPALFICAVCLGSAVYLSILAQRGMEQAHAEQEERNAKARGR